MYMYVSMYVRVYNSFARLKTERNSIIRFKAKIWKLSKIINSAFKLVDQ